MSTKWTAVHSLYLNANTYYMDENLYLLPIHTGYLNVNAYYMDENRYLPIHSVYLNVNAYYMNEKLQVTREINGFLLLYELYV